MKLRHLLLAVAVAAIALVFLSTCDLVTAPVSIDQRVADFQSDLNNTVRTSAYLNFHPTMTADYDALKSGTTITSLFPVPDGTGTTYTLTVTDESSPSTAVLVTVTGGPTSYGGTHHLKLVMATTSSIDWRVVSLSQDDGSNLYPGTPQIQ